MSSSGKSLPNRMGSWQVLSDNLRQDLADLPHLGKDLDDLDGMLVESQGLQAEIQVLRSRLRAATFRQRTLGRKGDMLRTRIGANLRGSLGFEDERLVKYGFKPRKRRRTEPAVPAAVQPPEIAGEEPGSPEGESIA